MIVAIVRLRETVASDEIVFALSQGGVSTVEVTLPTPGSLELVERQSGSSEIAVGVGTVRDRAGALSARDAGARFFVTPTLDKEVLDIAAESDIPVFCGAMTPSEIEQAFRHPAVRAVKVFPVGQIGGPNYIRAIRDPLDDIPLLPTGGVGIENISEYSALGCLGVGVAGSLVREDDVRACAWANLTERASELAAAWSRGREIH